MTDSPAAATPQIIVITGAMAAGKSTVAELLASRFPRAVHVRGDNFRRMIVNGREELALQPSAEALRQLHLRYDLTVAAAQRFAAEGFTAVVQDVIIGAELRGFIDRITWPERYLVVLSPSAAVLELREQSRPKSGYRSFSPGAMDSVLRHETAQIGYWLDSSTQSPEETADEILVHLDRARV